MMRAENEGFISLNIAPPEESTIHSLERQFVKTKTLAGEQVRLRQRMDISAC